MQRHEGDPSGELSRLTRMLMQSAERPRFGADPLPTLGFVAISGLSAAGDWFSGDRLSLALAYAVVVTAAAWMAPVRVAMVCAVVCSVGSGLVAFAHPESDLPALVATINAGLRLALLLAIAIGVELLRRSLAELSVAARRDPLTGLLNRRAVFEMAEHERVRALRSSRPMAVAYFDLDDLKSINDTAGHEAGDDLIRQFAAALRIVTRRSDLVGRLGGDEFIVVMPDTEYADGVKAINRMLNDELIPRASCGIVTSARPELPVEALIAAADQLMYEAKSSGGGMRCRETSTRAVT